MAMTDPLGDMLTRIRNGQQAKKDSVDTLLEAADLKADGRPRAVVAVGCLAERYGDQLAESLPVAQRNADPMELAIVDSRRREVEALLRESVREEEESKR